MKVFTTFEVSASYSVCDKNPDRTLSPEPLAAMLLTLRKIILPLLLTLQIIYCWTTFYKAQFLEYDDNYGLLIHSFIIALATLIILTIIWFRKRQLIKDNKVPLIIWTIIGSPLTFLVAAFLYEKIFGTTLAG